MDMDETVMLHKVRFVSEGTRTRLFLDDQEVLGCVKASFDYEVNALALVKLELYALNVEAEANPADVCVKKVSEEPIETLNLNAGIIDILRKGIWRNKGGEEQTDPVLTIGKLLSEFQGGRLSKYKGIGSSRRCAIIRALKERGLI